jgi:2'-5' RNA ligase
LTHPGAGARRRIFVAVPVAPALRAAALEAIRRVVGPAADGFRWVDSDALHVTLRFLGELGTPELGLAVEAAQAAAASSSAFSITLAGGGAFPSLRQPRILWVSVRDGADQLGALAQQLEAELAARRFPREARGFHAHVTVARLRSGLRAPDLRGLANHLTGAEGTVVGSQQVNAISVMESTLLSSGAVYREVERTPLSEEPRTTG